MQAIFRETYWLCLFFWQCSSTSIQRETIRLVSKALEVIALSIFPKNRWTNNNKFVFDFSLYNLVFSYPYNVINI
jgi:hypothetical protein